MDFGDLLFLFIFLLLPLLEGLFRKSKSGKKGQLPRRPPERPRAEARPAPAQPPTAPEEVATGAGEGRPWWEAPAEPAPPDGPPSGEPWEVLTEEPGWQEPPWWEEAEEDAATLEAEASEEPLSGWEEGLQRTAQTRVPVVHEPPRVVSLETAPLAPEARHTAFHTKLDSTAPRLEPRRRGRATALGLRGRDSLRRAVILKEVLGTPRGLDEWVGPSG